MSMWGKYDLHLSQRHVPMFPWYGGGLFLSKGGMTDEV